jgi:hypothetical protein
MRRRPAPRGKSAHYIAGFSPNMREVLGKFDFDNTISKLAEAGLLFPGAGALRRAEAEIRETEQDIVRMLTEVMGSRVAGE